MKLCLSSLILGILMSSCGQRDVLESNNWNLIDGLYNNKPIQFQSTDMFVITSNGSPLLAFSKTGEITLPGINSPNISATWDIEDGKIIFALDSIRYFSDIAATDYSSLEADSSAATNEAAAESPEKDSDKTINMSMLNQNDPFHLTNLRNAWKVYRGKFEYRISRDTLVLSSDRTLIRAVRDRTIDELFKNMQ